MSSSPSQDILEIPNPNEEEDDDDPFSQAFKELSETNRLADEITRVRSRGHFQLDSIAKRSSATFKAIGNR